MDYLTQYHVLSSITVCVFIKLLFDFFKNTITVFFIMIIKKTTNVDFIILIIKFIKIINFNHRMLFKYFLCNRFLHNLYVYKRFVKRFFKPIKILSKSKGYWFFINKIYKHSFIKKIKSKNITDLLIMYKPVYNKLNNSKYISKLFIRQSRFFTKTKFSSIRQECKNIVHLTLGLNTVFIFAILGVCFKWTFLVKTPVLLMFFYIIWALPVMYRFNVIFNYYKSLLVNKNN